MDELDGYSLANAMEDLMHLLVHLSQSLEACFGPAVRVPLPPAACAYLSAAGQRWRPPFDETVMAGARPADALTRLYEYAVYAERPADLHWERDCAPLVGFMLGHACEAPQVLPPERVNALRRLVRLAHARYVLDQNAVLQHGHRASVRMLTLEDIALLSGMDVVSVTNATDPRSPHRLVATPDPAGPLIDPGNALRWLRKRQGYRSTSFHADGGADGSAGALACHSAHELAQLLRTTRQAKGLNLAEVTRSLRLDPAMAAVIGAMEDGQAEFDPRLLRQLCGAYGLNPRPLILAALHFHQHSEAARYLSTLEPPPVGPPPPPPPRPAVRPAHGRKARAAWPWTGECPVL